MAFIEQDDESTQDTAEYPNQFPLDVSKQQQKKRQTVRAKMTLPEATLTLTVTNDFQGLDDVLFRNVAMNSVFGREVDYLRLVW